jgi:hypothetical protein
MEVANDKLDGFSKLPSVQAGEAYGPVFVSLTIVMYRRGTLLRLEYSNSAMIGH